VYLQRGINVTGGGELTGAIIPNHSKGFPRFEGKADVAESRFRTARISVRKITTSNMNIFFQKAQVDRENPHRASIFIPPDHDSYLTRDSSLGWRNGSISIEAQNAPMRNIPCTAIWRVINRVLMV
jgi:hypothetical protein